ncbi:hypothetical protein A3860_20250 [Niastella vici]|uniref:Ig-like domain-containing protein n=1 Tax=Niastella vici TaxID=1703345 RepID=A0A1V9G161_9BACT|nr:T9SS type A sorting domain-containing protein [Niastella vici]OQP64307.1 hypothetical protein A3860_20250 [Niastella vici]
MQRRLPKPFTLLLFFFLLSNYLSATPECPIVSGKFELADGTTSDASATGWYLDASKVASTGIFAVKSKRVHAQELGGEGIWYSRVFSTAGYSDFQVAVKVSSEGDMNSSEYVKIYYKINGGAETLLDSRTGNFGTIDFTSGTLTGSNVQLVVKIYNYNNGGSQTSKYYIEEYRVFKEKGPCAVSAINVTATAANGGILTCASPSLGLSATATGSGTTTWSWSGPNGYTSTAQNPTITAAGTYTVVATNSSGTGSASVAVTENKTAPVITATGGALACGSCVTISATSNVSGATYRWSGPNSFTSTAQNPTVCTAGTYTVTVTNPTNGCSAQQSVSVTAGSSAATTFWLEDFAGLSNGTTSDAGSTAWTTSVTGSGTYSVQNNEFKTSFSGSQGVGIWTSQSIDISSKTNVSFSVDLRSELASSSDAFETADYIRVYYKLNGGAETLVYEDLAGLGSTTNTNASATINSASLNGSTLQIIIKTSNSDPTERYYFDNIKVTGTSSSTGTVTVTPTVNGTVTCTATAQLSATASSSVSSWAWTGPNGFTSSVQNPAVSAGGQYVVTATLASGCAASATITVPENKTAPDITATGGNLACLSSITLNVSSTVSGATYKWTGPNSFTSTSKNPSVTAAGTYTATVTNPANGCTASQSVSVTAGSSAPATFWLEDFSDISNGATSDAGATAWTSTASGSGTYSVQNNEFKTSFDDQYEGVWTSQAINIAGKTNVTFSVDLRSEVTSGSFETADYIRVYYKLNGGAETLVFEDLAGLGSTTTGTASTTFTSAALNGSTLQVIIKTSNSGSAERYYFDNIKLSGSSLATETVTATGGTITCTTSSVTLLGNSTAGGVSYSWTGPNNFTSTAQNPVVTASGIYTLTVQNPATGCSGTDTALVALNTTAPGATASASGTLSCSGGSSVTLSGGSSTSGVTYSWTGPNNFTSTAQNPAVTVAGTYTVTVTNPANGCTSTANTTVTMSTSSTGTFWLEDFSGLSNGTTSDAGTTAWTSTASGSGTYSVQNNEFKTSFDDQYEGVWTSQAINIAGKTNVTFSVDLRSEVTSGSFETADYIRVYYKLNGGAETLVFEDLAGLGSTTTGTASTTFTSAALNGSTLQVIIKTSNSGSAERYYFDNVQVAGTTQSALNAVATATDVLTCTRNSVPMTGSTSATSAVNYSWTGPGNFTSAVQNPSATTAGIYTLTVTDPSTGCTGSDTALVSLNNTAPGATAAANGALTCTSSSTTLSGSSTTSGVSYSWTGPNNFTATTQNPAVTAAGTYYLTVTNPVNGCTSTATATVTQSNTVSSTWLEDFTLANGTTADAGTTPWTTSVNPSTALFSVLNNEFRVSNSSTNTGAEGVWTSGAINITGKTNAAISATVRSAVINGAVMNTDPLYGDYIRFYYKLNNGTEVLFAEKTAGINNHSTTPTPVSISLSGLNASTLQIVVRAKATGNDEFYYFDDVQAIASGPSNITASATGGAMNCINNSVTLQGSTAASGASYTWGGPNGYTSTAQNPVVTTAGTYTLTVALGSCTATATAAVTKDTTRPGISATANPIKLTCVATPATLTGSSTTSGVTYSWSNGVGVIATTPVTSVTTPGTYMLTVTNPANGCLSTSQVIVTQDIETPTGVTASHTGIITCNNPSIAISATVSSPSLTYRWSGPNGYTATTLNASVNKGGTYIITATNPTNGCFATASTIVEENTAPPGEISINNSGIITCLNTSITISGYSSSSGVNYVWEGPNKYSSNSSSANVMHGGVYTLTATNPGNGCKSSKSTNVVENTTAPAFTISNTSPITCTNPSATLTANTTTPGAQFMWVGPDFVSVDPSATVVGAGIYYITVTDPSNGCNATDFTEVKEDYSNCGRKSTTGTATGATTQNTPASVVTSFTYKAYPNPVATNGVIEFTSPQSANTSVSLYNALGTCAKVLFRGVITANRPYQVAVPATQLPAGAYYYIINTGGKSYTGKLMIVK